MLTAGAGAVLAVGFLTPLPSPANDVASEVRATTTPQHAGDNQLPPVDSFDAAFKRPLRVALTDTAPTTMTPTAPVAPSAAAPPPLVLVGTIGQSLAMIRTADGTVAVKGVGEQVGGADVLAIRPTQVDVRIGGKTVTLEKPVETEENP